MCVCVRLSLSLSLSVCVCVYVSLLAPRPLVCGMQTAIRFVLSDENTILRAEERQKLLHEGSGHAVMTAFVEIVFDNSDGRLPIEKDEVRLRRTIGLKKDEYQLDRKSITKTEVQNILESAGFSRSNPYYIVQQGKINSLATMTDLARLNLLKEIAGTKVYEERRKESLRIMNETEIRRKEIEELVKDMEERLDNLRAEKEELASYQQLDRKRRSIEFTMFDKEIAETRAKLEELDKERQNLSNSSAEIHDEYSNVAESLRGGQRELRDIRDVIERLQKERGQVEEELAGFYRRKTSLELDIKEVKENATRGVASREEIENELADLEKDIQTRVSNFEKVIKEHEKAAKEEDSISKTINALQRSIDSLYQKESRGQNFKSKKERDAWIHKQVQQRKAAERKARDQLKGAEAELTETRTRLESLGSEIASKSERMAESEQLLGTLRTEISGLVKQRNERQNQKRRIERENLKTQTELERYTQEKKKKLKQMERVIPLEINRGLNAVQNISKEYDVNGVHGTLMELFTCKENLNTAVEVTAGNSLFHVVVEDDTTASEILDHLSRDKGGRVTCMPLNRVRAPQVQYPDDGNVVPMISLLKYDKKLKNAMAHVFGRTLVCKDLDIATEWAKKSGLNCVTTSGEQVDRKGAMTGGFHDTRMSRISTFTSVREHGAAEEELRAKMEKERAELQLAEQSITGTLNEKMKKENARKAEATSFGQLRQECATLRDEEARLKHSMADKERHVASVRSNIEDLAVEIESLESEVGTALTNRLTVEESAQLESLRAKLRDEIEGRLPAVRDARLRVEQEKVSLEAVLEKNLRRRETELRDALRDIAMGQQGAAMDVAGDDGDLDAARDAVGALEGRLAEMDALLEDKRKAQVEFETECEKMQAEEASLQAQLQDQTRAVEKVVTKRATALQRRDELMKKIRDLGSISSESFDEFQDQSTKQLQKLLAKTMNGLKKFSSVNKKALDQYINFTEQRDELHQRREENNKGESKIKELIAALDTEKDEAIERTFRQVAMHFQEIFKELVQDGHGEMVMVRKLGRGSKQQQQAQEGDEEDAEGAGLGRDGSSIDKYSGIRVKVSFGADRGEVAYLNQLSGGQKTVVALALILAIQKCDPAPFYLFDEIDANLDAQHRTAVANMIRKQADTNSTQFVATTFKPELVRSSDQIFGVSMQNKISFVDSVDKEDALEFVEQDHAQQ